MNFILGLIGAVIFGGLGIIIAMFGFVAAFIDKTHPDYGTCAVGLVIGLIFLFFALKSFGRMFK